MQYAGHMQPWVPRWLLDPAGVSAAGRGASRTRAARVGPLPAIPIFMKREEVGAVPLPASRVGRDSPSSSLCNLS